MSLNASQPDASDPAVLDPANSITSVLERDQKGTLRSDAHQLYSFAAAGWLAILSTPLLFFPRILSLIFGSLLTESGDPEGEGKAEVIRQLNVLERSLAGMTGLSCLTLAAVLIIQTGAVPLTANISASHGYSPDALFRIPTVLVTTAFFGSLSWYSYDLGLWLVTVFSSVLSIWGIWAILFANESTVNKVGREKVGRFNPLRNDLAEAKKL